MDNPIRRSAAPLGEEQLAAAEAEVGLTFPRHYRAFLLEHNGGIARRNTFHHTNRKGKPVETWLGWIYSIGHDGKLDPLDDEVVNAYRNRPVGLPAGMLPVAHAWFAGNTGTVCVACAGDHVGQVFFRPNVEAEKDTLYPVAPRWDLFLGRLEYSDEKDKKKWKEYIQDGDADALRALLEKNSKWRGNHILRGDMGLDAVEEGHWPVVELLIEKGWSAASLFTRALGSRRFDLARHILLHTDRVDARAVQEALTDSDPLIFHLTPFVAELIDRGADVNNADSTGETPLHRAVEARTADGVRFLLERGADPTARNDDGRTPAALAQRLEEPSVLPALREAEVAWANRPAPAGPPEVAPLDLCGVAMLNAGPPLTLEQIAIFEREAGVELPPDYRAFLLQCNGGTPEPDSYPVVEAEPEVDGDGDGDYEDEDEGRGRRELGFSFFPLFPRPESAGVEEVPQPPDHFAHPGMLVSPEDLQKFYAQMAESMHANQSVQGEREQMRQTGMPRRMLPIGNVACSDGEDGHLLISCRGADRGRLYARAGYVEMHSDGTTPLLGSLQELFERLGEAARRPPTPTALLLRAIAAGDLGAARDALAQGAGALEHDRSGGRPLDAALHAGSDEIVLAMIEHGGVTVSEAFPAAVGAGRLDLAERLLEVNKGPLKKSMAEAMMHHGLYARPALLRRLLDRGASATGKKNGWPPLLSAAAAGNAESVQVLLDAGATMDAQSPDGTDALGMAAQAPGAAMTDLLLQRGARVNVANAEGATALHHAVRAGNLEAAKRLIEAGEDLHARHEVRVPGMSPDQQTRMMQQAAEGMRSMFGMMGDVQSGDDDAPPIDTSTPIGELLGQVQESLMARMADLMPRMQERLSDLASGSMGKGRSAAQAAADTPQGRAILAELEAFVEARKK